MLRDLSYVVIGVYTIYVLYKKLILTDFKIIDINTLRMFQSLIILHIAIGVMNLDRWYCCFNFIIIYILGYVMCRLRGSKKC